MSRKPEERLADIRDFCERILRFTAGMDHDRFITDDLVMDAVLRNIELIGEATKKLPDEIKARMPGIEWKRVGGMRDWLSHAYFASTPRSSGVW